MKVSLVMSSFCRSKLLKLGLQSLSQQKLMIDFEIIIVNDGIKDDTERICNLYHNRLNTKYLFTGQRNNKDIMFRSPSIALNIGIKQATGEIIILTCPEVFHLNETIKKIITPLLINEKILSTPNFIYFDNTNKLTNGLFNSPKIPKNFFDIIEHSTARCKYGRKLPLCMGVYKKELISIGGYDEDFTGWGADDDDIVDRLILNDLNYYYTDAKIIHLYHKKQYNRENKNNDKDYLHNLKLFRERKGKIIRNENREWGVL